MTELWLPNAELIKSKLSCGTYDRLDPKKVGIHTTEGPSIASAMSAYISYPPHVIASYEERRVAQHFPLNVPARSFKGSENDDEPVIQVELVGYARESRYWADEKLRWFAENVFGPIYQLWPCALVGPPQGFKDELDGQILARASSKHRFKTKAYEEFSGYLGHQPAPSPDSHWDPGALDIGKLLRFVKEAVHPEAPAAPDHSAQVAKLEQRVGTLEAQIRRLEGDMDATAKLARASTSRYDVALAAFTSVHNRMPNLETELVPLLRDDAQLFELTDKLRGQG